MVDPGFENPAPDPATSEAAQYFGGQTMGQWQVLGNDILLLASEHAEGAGPELYFNAHSGDAAVDLTGDANTGPTDGVSQTIATTPGLAYNVTFYVGNQTGTGSFGPYYTLPSTVDFQVDGGERHSFTNAHVIDNGIQWTQFYTSFVATGSSTTVAFLNGTPSADHYAGLDDVSISAVPEASSWDPGLVRRWSNVAASRDRAVWLQARLTASHAYQPRLAMTAGAAILAFVLTAWHDIPQGRVGRALGSFADRPACERALGHARVRPGEHLGCWVVHLPRAAAGKVA